ncbi:MAG: DUF4163 domain-containing protein [Clostridiales bacterium]|nr:DUF4163 domain-containing protein [Clostridiales bacterium]
MKKLSAAAMSCILAASMSVSALAAEENGAEKAVVSTEKATEETQVKTDDSIKVVVDGKEIIFTDQAPIIKNDRTMIPLRGVLETMGIDIVWNAEEQSITAERGDSYALFKIGETTLKTAEGEITLDVAPEIINDRTMIPLRAVTESFGAEVTWDADTKTVTITDEIANTMVEAAKLTNEVKAADGTVLYTIDVKYPVLNDKCKAAGKKAVNETIKKSIEESVAADSEEIKKAAEELYNSAKETEEKFMPLSVMGDYKVTLENSGTLSFYVDLSYNFNGAHPMTYRNGYTYDLESGKELMLSDVTDVSENKAMEIIKNAYTEAIKADTENKTFFTDALKNLDETLKTVDFYLEDKNIVFFTELYSVAPYAAGFVNVPVSLEKFA